MVVQTLSLSSVLLAFSVCHVVAGPSPPAADDSGSSSSASRSQRWQRDLWSINADVKSTATCYATVARVAQECKRSSESKVSRILRDPDHEPERCCAFTEFRKCVRDKSCKTAPVAAASSGLTGISPFSS